MLLELLKNLAFGQKRILDILSGVTGVPGAATEGGTLHTLDLCHTREELLELEGKLINTPDYNQFLVCIEWCY